MNLKIILLIFLIAGLTYFTRLIPFFFIKSKKIITSLTYLENNIPPMILLLLVIYCLKDIVWGIFPFGIPEILSILIVTFLHLLFKNVLLSIFLGTTIYMIFVNYLFV